MFHEMHSSECACGYSDLRELLDGIGMAKALPLDKRLDVAAQLVIQARIFYDIWWFYEGRSTRPRILNTMRVYNEFFRFDTHAHFVSMVIHLAALFEKKPNTINFGVLIEEAEADGASKEAVDKARALMEQFGQVSTKVRILRHNLFAHRSASLSYENAFKIAAFTPFELRLLAAAGLKIANILLTARGLEEQIFDELSREDVERLVNDLAKASVS